MIPTLVQSASHTSLDTSIKTPLNLYAPRGPQVTQKFVCANVQPPPASFILPNYYENARADYSSAERQKAFRDATSPVMEYIDAIVRSSDASLIATKNQKQVIEECIVHNLSAWAEAHAFVQTPINSQGRAIRTFEAVGLCIAYLKIVGEPGQHPIIENWLGELGWTIWRENRNFHQNIEYWSAAAVSICSGLIKKNADAMHIGAAVFNSAMLDIAKNGSLPNEMKRGSRIVHYHQFSLMGLLLILNISEANSIELNTSKLGNLVKFTLNETASAGKGLGLPQEWTKTHENWLYLCLWSDTCSKTLPINLPIAKPADSYFRNLGGDQKLLWMIEIKRSQYHPTSD
jgi:hypothetical protein